MGSIVAGGWEGHFYWIKNEHQKYYIAVTFVINMEIQFAHLNF